MELSNYQAFMECMRKWEKIGCNILCGLALWEQMYHEKIDALLDTYARKLAENLNDH